MFTGIIEEIGKVLEIKEKKDGKIFKIVAKTILEDKKIGQSIAVNGVCITINKLSKNNFSFFAIEETLKLTNLNQLKENDEVNLESALKLNQGLDGHLVQGHIDCLGELISITKSENNLKLKIKFPKEISKHLAFKGSITINGVSLTIADLRKDNFTVEIIPHTIEMTNLKKLKKTDKINLEVDIISKYLERLLKNQEKQAKYSFLHERGFI